jgi:hypothetical protein
VSKGFRRLVWVLGGVAAVLLIAFGVLRYEMWKTEGCECGAFERTPFTVYNPLRDRGPEVVAARFLDAAQGGRCLELPASLFVAGVSRDASCMFRDGNRLTGSELRSRGSYSAEVLLGYGVGWNGDPDRGDPLLIAARKIDGVWRIERVEVEFF